MVRRGFVVNMYSLGRVVAELGCRAARPWYKNQLRVGGQYPCLLWSSPFFCGSEYLIRRTWGRLHRLAMFLCFHVIRAGPMTLDR